MEAKNVNQGSGVDGATVGDVGALVRQRGAVTRVEGDAYAVYNGTRQGVRQFLRPIIGRDKANQEYFKPGCIMGAEPVVMTRKQAIFVWHQAQKRGMRNAVLVQSW